jgi:3-oxoacyl-[acyl-carrier protein] reductase
LVTAASQGIGFGVAKAFLEEGAMVLINSSDKDKIEKARTELASFGDVQSVQGDISKKQDIEKVVSAAQDILGGIDTFVYVTGSPAPGPVMEKTYEDWDGASRLLSVSPAYFARKVAEVMISGNTRGRIVFSASYAIREPIATIALSSVLRTSIGGLTRTLARELGPKGIRVNAVLPGHIRTARAEQIAADTAKRRNITKEEAISETESQIPLGRYGTTEELARAILFLGSDLSSYVTGTMLPVDGGILRSIG